MQKKILYKKLPGLWEIRHSHIPHVKYDLFCRCVLFNFQEQHAPPERYSAPSQGHSFRIEKTNPQASSLYPHTISEHCWVPFLVSIPFFHIFYLSKGRGVLKKLKKTNDLNGFPQQDSWRPLHHLTTGNQTQVPQLLLLQLLEICRYTLNLIHGIRNQLNLMKLPYAYGTPLNMHKPSYAWSFSTFRHSLPAFRTPALHNEMFQSSKTCDKSRRESASQSKAWHFMTNLCLKVLEKRKSFDEIRQAQWCTMAVTAKNKHAFLPCIDNDKMI